MHYLSVVNIRCKPTNVFRERYEEVASMSKLFLQNPMQQKIDAHNIFEKMTHAVFFQNDASKMTQGYQNLEIE